MKQQFAEIQVSYPGPDFITTAHQISSSHDAYELCMNIWNDETIALYEEFVVIYLNQNNRVIGYRLIGRGSTNACVVNVKLLIWLGLSCNCTSLILAHNHPSGNLEPSNNDVILTKKIQKAAELFEIKVLDHLIITTERYYSFSDEGNFESA